jgi:hypothetical protein
MGEASLWQGGGSPTVGGCAEGETDWAQLGGTPRTGRRAEDRREAAREAAPRVQTLATRGLSPSRSERSERSERLARWAIVDEEGHSMAQPGSPHAGSHIPTETTGRAICCGGPDAAKRRRT